MPISNAGAIMAASSSSSSSGGSSTDVVERESRQWIEVREPAESRQTSHAVEAPITEVPV